MGLFLSRSFGTPAHLLSFISFFVRSESRSFVLTRASPCRRAQELSRLAVAPTSWHAPPLPGHTLTLRARRHARCGRDDDQRGARFRARINRATTLYSVGPRTRTMMQPCASAAKLRGGGPILPLGMTAMSHLGTPSPRDPATSNRHRRPVTSGRTGPKLSGVFSDLRSLRRAQYDAVRHHALPHQPPQGDQKLARQGHDHGLASAAGGLGAGSKPLRQGALLLEHEKSPRQLDHASPNSSVAGTGQPFLPAFCAALVGRAREARITRYGPSVAHVSRQHLLHQHVRGL